MSTHLYRIAQESVNNAIKHGQARNITINLSAGNGRGILRIENDGTSLLEPVPNRSGMGMQIMNYRARMIGGSLKVENHESGGMVVSCFFPVTKDNRELKGPIDDR